MTHQAAKSRLLLLVLPAVCVCVSVGCATENGGLVLTGKNAYKPISANTTYRAESLSDDATTASTRALLVARNLVSTMVQVSTLDPITTAINMEKPAGGYGSILADELERAGYDLLKSARPDTPGFLQYTIKSVAHTDGPAYEFVISVADIKFRRQYRLQGDSIKPVSAMFVSGTPAGGILIDDSVFDSDPDSSSATGYVITEGVADLKPGSSVQSLGNETLQAKALHNLYETRKSNYHNLIKDYDDVKQVVLVFDNDSITLGTRNKGLAREMVSLYKKDTDLLSVIGCSHGKTAAAGKNRALALGRSSRVREELILSGVNPGHVLDEGCWDSRHFDQKMPRRGVVLTLKRQRTPSP